MKTRFVKNHKMTLTLSLLLMVFLLPCTMQGQNDKPLNEMEGFVFDTTTSPLIGVTVTLKGKNMGTVTDENGRFKLMASSGDILVFQYMGFQTQEVKVGSEKSLRIILLYDDKLIDEVVVVGYGVQKKKDLTGSIATVKASDLNMVNAVSVDNLLQGKAAGLVVTQYTAQPGGAVSMNIRGGGTPLYVIDGVPLFNTGTVEAGKIGPATIENTANGSARSPLSTFNPSDIESIDILKDASATAIYGSAAANGVVLITTKKGRTGKVNVTYNGSVSTQKISKKLDMLNGPDFRKYMDLAHYEDWLASNNYYPYGNTPAPATGAPARLFTDQEIAGAPTYDHLDEISRTGVITDHNISMSGGSEKSMYYVSLNYFDQQSVLKSADYRRFSGRVNLEQNFNDWLKLSMNMMYTATRANNAQIGVNTDGRASRENGNEAKMTGSAMIFAPDTPLENEDGSLATNSYFSQVPNPLSFMAVRDMTDADRLFFVPNLEIAFTNYLKGNMVLGVDKSSANRDMWGPNRAKLPLQKEDNYGGFSRSYSDNYSLEGYLSFNKTLGIDHRLSAVVGLGYYRQDQKSHALAAYNLSVEALENYNLSLATDKELDVMNSWKSRFTKISQFARLNYIFKNRYILGLTVRRDGSDAFPPSKKYGLFPGISAGWAISEEGFMAGINWIDNLKIRAGYGTTGNENTVRGNYYYLDQYATAYGMNYMIGGKLYSGVSQSVGKNVDFVWQTDESMNAGIDFSFIKGRLTGTLDLYQRITQDLLGYTYPPITATVARRVTNIGSQRYRGIELGISGDIIRKKDFIWSAYVNMNTNKRTWVERDPTIVLRSWVGEKDEVNAIYGWKTDGIFQSREEVQAYVNAKGEMYQPTSHPGNLKYIDLNGDGVLDEDDVVYLGCGDPKLYFGLGTTLNYKGFDLNIGTYGRLGWLTRDNWGYVNFRDLRLQNQSVYVKEIWTSFNPTGTRQGIKGDTSLNVPSGNDFQLQNTWYLRLKNVTLGYTLPSNWLQKIHLGQGTRIYVDVQNLSVLTNYRGVDPEMERDNASPFPIPFSVSMGININF